ncbi:MAG: hypothetical protein Hyperionvirus3_158 [Hyperionvirus sp.]|uniref:Leucine-rich repeat protein n=1 Tax=Hyperionvirus sp. TaxID=2487770 RepID=A0A3G5A7J2_9VIRU|nr:MAG: hypothetical protein Hyperionvirus3_158 [Hyperionvirus sp.]
MFKKLRPVPPDDTKSAPLFTIPPLAICDFYTILDLVTLRRTHRSFSQKGKICQEASPLIHLTSYTDYSQVPIQFPKAKLLIEKTSHHIITSQNSFVLANITSLNIPDNSLNEIQLEIMTRLTSFSLSISPDTKTLTLDELTQLTDLELHHNTTLEGIPLRKLTSLRRLNLNGNMSVKDLDIESLPLHSLSLGYNSAITPSVLATLRLTYLNISGSAKHAIGDEIIKCRTLTELELNMNDLIICGLPAVKKMGHLRKLILHHPQKNYEEYTAHLTNLTHLEIHDINTQIEVIGPRSIQTLHVIGRTHYYSFTCASFDNLTYLKLDMETVNIIINFNNLRKLTYLDMYLETPTKIDYRELGALTILKKIILRIGTFNETKINLSPCISLTSVEILSESNHSSFSPRDLIANENIQSLTIKTLNTTIHDNSFDRYPNLNYLSLHSFSYVLYKCKCFENLHKLALLEIAKHQHLDTECIVSLERRGIMIRRISS